MRDSKIVDLQETWHKENIKDAINIHGEAINKCKHWSGTPRRSSSNFCHVMYVMQHDCVIQEGCERQPKYTLSFSLPLFLPLAISVPLPFSPPSFHSPSSFPLSPFISLPYMNLMDSVFSIAVWNDRRYWNFEVGQDGAKLQVRNISLTVPPGALMEECTITVAISCNPSDIPKLPDNQHLVGPVVHFLPHGLKFQQPVTLSFHGITVMQESSKMLVLHRYEFLYTF